MSETANLAVARSAALAAIAARAPESSDAIEYSSAGTVVVAGDATNPARALQAAQALGETPVTILLHDESSTTPIPETRDGVATVVCRLSSVDGHLGAFNVPPARRRRRVRPESRRRSGLANSPVVCAPGFAAGVF